ncbi:hypothetical protein [Pseudoxanthomonas mexicana]|nr:hypothetical protein [Pseudoxanthomonas sp.]
MTPKKQANKSPAIAAIGNQQPFVALRGLLLPYRSELEVIHDDPGNFYANCLRPGATGKAQFFAAVKTSGRKHLFHFMPVYDFPELLDNISPDLRRRMQGKSCFNFDKLDPILLEELAGIIVSGTQRYRAIGKL